MRRRYLLIITTTLIATGLAFSHNVRLALAATPDTFVVKFNPSDGSIVSGWDPRTNAALKYDSGGSDLATGIAATNPAGTIYAATGTKVIKYNTSGTQQSVFSINTTTNTGANNTIATVPNSADFIAVNGATITRYNSSGSPVWSNTVPDQCSTYEGPFLFGVAIENGGGNVYATGRDYPSAPGCGNRRLARTFKYSASAASPPTWNVFSPVTGSAGDNLYGYDVAVNSTATRAYIAMELSTGFRLNKLNATAGGWEWNSANLGAFQSSARAVAIDSADNVYVTGWYKATSTSNYEFYIAKYNSANSLLASWPKNKDIILNDTYDKYAHGIALDASGNAYVVGRYVGARTDALITKLDVSGNYIWSKTFDMGQKEEGYAIAVDSTGIYVEGYFLESKSDLTVSGLAKTPSAVNTGDPVTFSGDVYNGGETTAPSSQTRLRIDIGNDGTYDVTLPDQPTGQIIYPGFAHQTWPTWSATGSTAKYEICADATGLVAESNETNNCRVSSAFSIGQKITITVVGSGTVTAAGGINCVGPQPNTGTCFAGYVVNTGLALTATPNSGAVFSSWSGDCSGTSPTFGITMNGPKNCTATFTNVAAPTVVSPTKNVTSSTSATLGATVTSNGGSALTQEGTCFSLTANPTLATGNCDNNAGTTIGLPFSYPRTGMTANTLYYYRGYASNAASTGYSSGGDTFTTLPDAPSAPTFTNVQPTTLTVNWTAPAGGSVALTYKVERLNSSCSTVQNSWTTTNLYQNDTGLIGNTTYCYRVSATNTANSPTYGNPVTGTRDTLPNAPTGLTFANVLTTTLTVNWTAPAGGSVALTYKVERLNSSCSTVQNSWTTTNLYQNDTGLIGNTTYCYRVSATNTANSPTYGNPVTGSKLTEPGAPGTPSFSNITSSSVTVSWSPPLSGPSTGLTYRLERCTGTLCGGSFTNVPIVPSTNTSTTDNSGFTEGTVYRYHVFAINADGAEGNTPSDMNDVTISNYTINITEVGGGSGTVSFIPSATQCSSFPCTRPFASGTTVTLTANSSTFGGWSGDALCFSNMATQSSNVTNVTMSVSTINCTVKFNSSSAAPTVSPVLNRSSPLPVSRNPQVTSGGYPIVVSGTGFNFDGGRLVYGTINNSDDRFRRFDGNVFLSPPLGTGGTVAENEIAWEKVVHSPTRSNEYIAGRLQTNNTNMYIQTCLGISGCDIADDWTIAEPRGFSTNIYALGVAVPLFDIAYEQQSGDALAVWRSQDYKQFSWRVWNGNTGTWAAAISGPQNLGGANDIRFVKLVADPNSDQIALVWSEYTNKDVRAIFWNGSGFIGSSSVICGNLNNTDRWSFDAEWEQVSGGRLLVVCSSTVGAMLDVKYYSGGWQTSSLDLDLIDGGVSVAGAVNQLQLFANPSNNNIGFIKTSVGPNGIVQVGMWDGLKLKLAPSLSSFGQADDTGYAVQTVDGAWLNSSTAVAVFNESDDSNLHYVKWTSSGWGAHLVTSFMTGYPRWFQAEQASDGTVIVVGLIYNENFNRGELVYLTYNGSSWTNAVTLATDMSLGNRRPFYFAPRKSGTPAITIGGIPATASSISSMQITIPAAPGQTGPGFKDVVVTNPNGTSTTCTNCMEYVAAPSGLSIQGQGDPQKMEFAPVITGTNANAKRTISATSGLNPSTTACVVKEVEAVGGNPVGSCLDFALHSTLFNVPNDRIADTQLSLRVYGDRGTDDNGIYAPLNNAITYRNKPSFGVGQGLQGTDSSSFMQYVPRGSPAVQRTINGTDIGYTLSSPLCAVKVGSSCATLQAGASSSSVTVEMPTIVPNAGPYEVLVYGRDGTYENGIFLPLPSIVEYVNRPSGLSVNNSYVPAGSPDPPPDWGRMLTGSYIKSGTGTGILNICNDNDFNGCGSTNNVNITDFDGTRWQFVAPHPRARASYAGRVYGGNGTDTNGVYANQTNLLIYENKPFITDISPQCYLNTSVDTTVNIKGSNLFGRSGGAKVDTSYVTTTPTGVSGDVQTELSLTTPPHAGIVPLRTYSEHGDDGNTLYWTEDMGLSFGNQQPIARINGATQLPVIWTKLGRSVQLNGGSSYDPEQGLTYCAAKGIQTYSWSVVSPSSGYTGAPSSNASISFTPIAIGKYDIKLEVTDFAPVSYTNRTNAISVMVRTLPVWREIRSN